MKTRDRDYIDRTRRMLRAAARHPSMVVTLPAVGLAEVWHWDGSAYLFPGFGGLIICPWWKVARHVRRQLN